MYKINTEIHEVFISIGEKTEWKQQLLTRIAQRVAHIGVIGLGYVGLPLSVEWARAGFRTTGIDINSQCVSMCQRGQSWIEDVSSDELAALVKKGQLSATTDQAVLAELDVVCICVPTPLNEAKEPELSAVLRAVEVVAQHLHHGQLVVLQSTTYPGTTQELVLPYLHKAGLLVGQDFFLAFSPERTDPGNSRFALRNTPKIVSGITEACLEVTATLYATVVEEVIAVSSTCTAELVKLLENTFRAVNIGLVNELAIIANLLKVDVWEVIAAARTKPFGYMPFYPGPGIGGHCVPVDPHYLAWKMRTLNYHARFIEVATEINERMPGYVVERMATALNEYGKCLNGARLLVLGVTYKRDTRDIRESPALPILELLSERKAHINYVDPYIPTLKLKNTLLTSVPLSDEQILSADCVVIITDHKIFDYEHIAQMATLIIDTRNATNGIPGAQIWRL
jgi:UDP-N-acetyl-D-glucosamine dehydrogenase